MDQDMSRAHPAIELQRECAHAGKIDRTESTRMSTEWCGRVPGRWAGERRRRVGAAFIAAGHSLLQTKAKVRAMQFQKEAGLPQVQQQSRRWQQKQRGRKVAWKLA